MNSGKILSLDGIKVACSNCGLSTLCLPFGLQPQDVERLEQIIQRNRPLQRGQMLFQPGDTFHNLYVVKTGAIKSYTQSAAGDENVIGFHLPGEILGLDAIQDSRHSCFAKALETTAICEMPFERLEHLSSNIPSLQHQMLRLLSRELGNESQMISLLNNSTAEQRLAAFLISLSDRLHQRGFSANEFFLAMSRQDIGSYLGLALETVSRLFTRFQEQELLLVDRKHVCITDLERLRSLANCHAFIDPSLQSSN